MVQSHLHYDHAGGLEFVQEATVYVQHEELTFAYWPPVYQRDVYVRQDFDRRPELEAAARRARHLQRRPPDHLSDARPHARSPVDAGAGWTARRTSSPGDAVYDKEKMQARCLPGLLWSPDAIIESWEKIEELQRRHDARLIVTHDLHWQETIKLGPEEWYE